MVESFSVSGVSYIDRIEQAEKGGVVPAIPFFIDVFDAQAFVFYSFDHEP